MLILTRKVGESLMVGDQVRVVVVDVKGRQVRLGVEAPAETKIYRAELYERIQEENSRASLADQGAFQRAEDLWSSLGLTGGGDAD